MPFPNHKKSKRRTAKPTTGKLLDHTANALFRWLTTNHSFYATLYLDPPTPGLLGAIRYAVKSFLISVGVPLLRALLIVVLYMLWIPFLINALLWLLQQ